MIVEPQSDGSLRLRGLPLPVIRMLQQVPQHADISALPEMEDRLIQKPLSDDDADEHPEIQADWENYVTPGLRDELAEDLDFFIADLAAAQRLSAEEIADLFDYKSDSDDEAEEEADEKEADDDDGYDLPQIYAQLGFYDLVIPADHRAAWYSALNQARLVMHGRHGFPEENETFEDQDEDDDDADDSEDQADSDEKNELTAAQRARRQAYQSYQFYAQVQFVLLHDEPADDEDNGEG
jgi:hypothetical protein